APKPRTQPPSAAQKLTSEALAQVKAHLEGKDKAARLTLITQGALATSQSQSPDPAQAAIWGLVRSAQSEHPGRFCLIDTDASEASEQALGKALALGEAEPQIALREGAALAPRLTRAEDPPPQAQPALDPDKTVLITGATGGLGALTARHLASH